MPINYPPSAAPSMPVSPRPTSHVCHWQNCHATFSGVQDLLAHISTAHLGIPSNPTPFPNPNFFPTVGTQSHAGTPSNSPPVIPSAYSPQATSIPNQNVQIPLPAAFSPLAPTFPPPNNTQMDMSSVRNEGLLACLWDDCNPMSIPVDGFNLNTGFNFDNTNTSFDPIMFPTPSTVPQQISAHTQLSSQEPHLQQHPHQTCQVPLPIDNANPLDSASAVLKHLLEQHLGVNATQNLLDVANKHYTNATAASAGSMHSRRPSSGRGNSAGELRRSIGVVASGNGKPQNGMRSNDPGTSVNRATTVPSVPMPTTKQTEKEHRCRWHGCGSIFADAGALTDHVTEEHVGRGKSSYECMWDGCVRCDHDCESCDEGESEVKKDGVDEGKQMGRKFATRQKVLRHIQSHTGVLACFIWSTTHCL